MNLYRSFGNLLEMYVADGGSFVSAEEQTHTWTNHSGNTTPASTPDILVTQRSESDDSGFEIMTCSSFDAADSWQSSEGNTDHGPVSVSTDGQRGSLLLPSCTLTSIQQPPISSSSPSLFLASANEAADPLTRERCMSLHNKVEQALLNIPQNFRKARSESNFNAYPDTVAQRRVPVKTLSLSRGLAAERALRSAGEERSPVHLMLRQVRHQRLERKGRPTSLYHHMRLAQTPIEEVNEEPREGLSPGLRYLEQVCQMGEEIAQRRTHNQRLHLEMKALSDHRDTEPASRLYVCQAPPEEHLSPTHRTTVLEFGRMSEELHRQRSDTDEDLRKTLPSSEKDTPTALSDSETNTRGQPESRTQPAEPENGDQNQRMASQILCGDRSLRPRGVSRAAFWKKAKSVDSAGPPQGRMSDARRRIGQRFSMLIPRKNLQAQ